MWSTYIKGFVAYLQLERSFSKNSVEAYERDLKKLQSHFEEEKHLKSPQDLSQKDLEGFIQWMGELELNERSQARMISAIKSFYKFMMLEEEVKESPALLIEGPKLPQTIPSYLTVNEVNALLEAVDLSHPQGHRNRSIVETLYACGLRVSELVGLKISNLFLEVEMIRIIGKGNRERLVPINQSAIKYLHYYLNEVRAKSKIKPGFEDCVYLNRRGKGLTRVMIFTIIKDLSQKAGIQKKVSPHTLRHTFATHLYEAGADLRAIQDMLGHQSILTTEIYSDVDVKHLKKTLENYHPRFR